MTDDNVAFVVGEQSVNIISAAMLTFQQLTAAMFRSTLAKKLATEKQLLWYVFVCACMACAYTCFSVDLFLCIKRCVKGLDDANQNI